MAVCKLSIRACAGVHLIIIAIHDSQLIMGYLENNAAEEGANMLVRPPVFEHCR
jgi:hypothetical protein